MMFEFRKKLGQRFHKVNGVDYVKKVAKRDSQSVKVTGSISPIQNHQSSS
jgi:hypothetical protein